MVREIPEREVSHKPPARSLTGWSEFEFHRLLEKLPAGAYMCDSAGLITYFNQRAVEIWGRAPKLNDPEDRFCGSFKLLSSDGSPIRHDQCWMALALRENMAYDGREIIIERPDGSRLTTLAHANPIHNESGELLGAVNVLVDISDRKQAEEALRQAHNELGWRVAERTAALAASNEALQREIAERKQAEERAQRRAAHAEAQAQAAALLNAQLDLETVLATVCRVTADVLKVSVILVYLFDKNSDTFVFTSGIGLPHELERLLRPLPRPLYDYYTGQLGPVKRFLNLSESLEWLAPELVNTLHLQRATIVDLTRGGEIIGCVMVLKLEQDRWLTPEELALLKGLADQAAQAITNARLHQEVEVRKSQLQRLNQLILKAEEEERKRLSRELHDSAGQITTALLINLSLLRQDLPPDNTELLDGLETVRELAQKIHNEIRAVSHTLRPPELETMSLDEALNELCEELSKLTRQPILYEGTAVPPLSDAVTVTFYRFVQEALNNAIKHAAARCIMVRLQYQKNRLHVTVEDDGVGFDVSAQMNATSNGGIGLMSMHERLEMLGGEMEIYSTPGCGTRLVASYQL